MQNDNVEVGVEIPESDRTIIERMINDGRISGTLISNNSFSGTNDVVTLVMTLGLAGLGAVLRIILAEIKSRSGVSIVYDGVIIQGVSQERVPEIIRSIADSQVHDE